MSIITYNFVVKVVRKKILTSFSYNRFFDTILISGFMYENFLVDFLGKIMKKIITKPFF